MCIIIWKPEKIELFNETIETCFTNNPDGAGFTYVENNELHTERGFFTVESFKEAYEPHKLKSALLHFRIRTHGDYAETNCHPFEVTPELVFAHNGTIAKMPHDKEKSDTALFNELVVKNLVRVYGKELLYDSLFTPMLESYIGWSKLVFLDNNGQVSIVGEKSGNWASGCWFSNTSWQQVYKKYDTSTYSQYGQVWDEILGCYVVDFKKKNKKHKQSKNLQALPPIYVPPTRQGTIDWPSGNEGNLPQVPLLPDTTPLYKPSSSRPLQLNDYLRLNQNLMGAERGWLGKIMGFYGDNSVEIYFPLHKRTMRINIAFLDLVTPNVIAPSKELPCP